MHAQIRIAVVLVTVLVGAVLAATMREDSTPTSPGRPTAAPTQATAGSPELSPPIAVAEFDPGGEAPEALTAHQRTAVAGNPSGRRAPIRDEERVAIRATSIAKKLKLSAAGEDALLAVLLEEQTRRAAALTAWRRRPDDAEADARLRTELDAILAWKTRELRRQFGPEYAGIMMRR